MNKCNCLAIYANTEGGKKSKINVLIIYNKTPQFSLYVIYLERIKKSICTISTDPDIQFAMLGLQASKYMKSYMRENIFTKY